MASELALLAMRLSSLIRDDSLVPPEGDTP